jgi:hypothetical protein
MFVSDLEKIVAIELAYDGRDFVEDKIDQCAPPILVVILTWAIARRAGRHLLPGRKKRRIQFRSVQFQADLFPDQRVMIADGFCQIDQSSDRVEEDCSDHAANLQRPARLRNDYGVASAQFRNIFERVSNHGIG